MAEWALRESEQRFRLAANSAPVMIWMPGKDKLCTFFNEGWLNFRGRKLEEELAAGWIAGFHPKDVARCMETHSSAFQVAH